MPGPRIAMIHATPAAIGPAVTAFEQRFPEATLWHLLEDRLLQDAEAAGGLTPELRQRMLSIIDYAARWGADGIQLTCSVYGSVATLARQVNEMPVYGSDEAMHLRVLHDRPARLALVASFDGAATDAADRLRQRLQLDGAGQVDILRVVPEKAKAAVDAGEGAGLVKALHDEMAPLDGHVDAFLICQYSLSPAVADLSSLVGAPVLSPPHLAAARLRSDLVRGVPTDA